ncbi:fumarate hydratase [Escherichia coli]
MRTLGTAACPPYHIAFVIGGTSAETNLKTVKLASAKYYDELPTEKESARSGIPRCGTGKRIADRSAKSRSGCAVWW